MTRLQKYRLFVFGLLIVSLAGLGYCSYLYLRDQIPDHILIEEGQELPVIFQSSIHSIIKEETVEAASRKASDIPKGAVKMENAAIECSILGVIPLKTVEVEERQRQSVQAGGTPVGIYMETDGILVIGTGTVDGMDGQPHEPSEHILKTGDYILGADGQKLRNKEELVACMNRSEGEQVNLEVLRDGRELLLAVTPVKASDDQYKAGVWVRNDAQGVGTLTYIDEEGNFGALGHGISDVDTSTLLSLKEGKLYEADIVSVTKGEKGTPGELAGVIHYQDSSILGSITQNTSAGIYGTSQDSRLSQNTSSYEVAYKQEVEPGPAVILCSAEGSVQEYEIEICSLELNKKEVNKGMTIRVTDQELLKKTGGIVQGMSGSPIIQNGKLVGAVTHVFVNDPTKGYGIFIENMLEH